MTEPDCAPTATGPTESLRRPPGPGPQPTGTRRDPGWEAPVRAEGDQTGVTVVRHHPVASVWNVANALTAGRLVLVPVFGWFLLRGMGELGGWRVGAVLTFAAAAFTDRLDGELARRRGLVTDLGKIADPIADKALIGTALVGLSLLRELSWWVTVVVLAREIGITLLRLVVIRHGVMPAGRGGKAKTALQTLAITLYLLPLTGHAHVIAAAMMAVAVLVTVVTGLEYLAQAGRLVAGSERTRRRREQRAVGRR